MKRLWVATIGAFLGSSLIVLSFLFFSPKQPFKYPSIAVVDSVRIKSTSIPFLEVRRLLEDQHRLIHDEIAQEESYLREEYDFIRNSLDPSGTIQNRRQKLDEKVSALQQRVQKKQEILNQQFSLLTNLIEKKFDNIVHRIAKEKNIAIVVNTDVLEKKVILYSEESLDITDEVIKLLDQELPKVTLPPVSETQK